MRFLQEWYRRCITGDQILTVFSAWQKTEWEGGVPSLVFTRPKKDFTPFWPKRTVEVVGAHSVVVQLRFEIFNNLTNPWYETADITRLPQIVVEFLQTEDEKSILVDLGPNCPTTQ